MIGMLVAAAGYLPPVTGAFRRKRSSILRRCSTHCGWRCRALSCALIDWGAFRPNQDAPDVSKALLKFLAPPIPVRAVSRFWVRAPVWVKYMCAARSVSLILDLLRIVNRASIEVGFFCCRAEETSRPEALVSSEIFLGGVALDLRRFKRL